MIPLQKSLYTDSNASGRLRAVIYNRCSTEEESQREALVKQEREARECVAEQGWIGIFTGPFTAAAGGVAAAVLFGVLAALLFRPGEKR